MSGQQFLRAGSEPVRNLVMGRSPHRASFSFVSQHSMQCLSPGRAGCWKEKKKNGKNCQSNNKQLHLRTAQGKRTEESRETSIPLLLCGSATLFGKGACAGNRSQSHALAWPSPSTVALHLILATWAKVPKSSWHKMPS